MNIQTSPLKDLFRQWQEQEQELAACSDENEDAVYSRLSALGDRILKAKPKTVQDLAIQVLVFTNEGDAIAYENAKESAFVKGLKKLANA